MPFPAELDEFSNPSANNPQNSPSHSQQHILANDAIEALQVKVGIDDSEDATSFDYRIRALEEGGSFEETDPIFAQWLATDPLSAFLTLDQTTPQTVVNGVPIFNEGWQSNKWYRNGLGTTLEIHTGRDNAFDAIATSTTDAGALTSIRTNMNRGTAAVTTILATNAYRLWIGHNQPFNTVGMWIVRGASANTTIVEYWNGTAWAEVPNKTDGTSNLSGPGTITFDIPEDWATLDKDGEARYWLKFRTNVSTATDATVQLIQPIAYTAHDLFNFLPNPLDVDTSNGIFINTFGKVKIPRISGAVAVEGAVSAAGAVSAVGVAVGGALSGATTVAHSGLLTGTLSGATETPIVGHYLLGAATTGVTAAFVPTRYSPSMRFLSRSWDIDNAVDRTHYWQIDSAPYAGNEPSSRLRITHGTGYTNLVNLSDDGTASFLGTTYGDEVLSNGAFTSGTGWSVSGGFSLTSDTAKYVHNAAGGTLTQASGDFATPLLPNRWYRLTYTTSAINTTARMYIGSEVSAKEREYLQGTLVAGTYTQWFKTNSSPGDFVIYADSAAAADGFTLDDISLVPVISGNIEAMGTIWGQGYYSADRTAGASAVTGGLTFKNGLYTAGTATSISFGTTTQIPYMNVGGTDFLYSANLVFDGSILTAANIKDSGLTSGRVTYATTAGLLTDSANMTFDGDNFSLNSTDRVAVFGNFRTISSRLTGQTAYLMDDDLTWSGAYGGLMAYCGVQHGCADNRNLTTTFSASDFVIGTRFNGGRGSSFVAGGTGTFPGSLGFTSLQNNASDYGTYQRSTADLNMRLKANEQYHVISPTINVGAKTVNYYAYINDTILGANNPTLTSGTLNFYYQAYRVTGTGSTTGNSVGHAYYTSLSGFDTCWGFYNDSASSNLLGLDNSKTYFGTGLDAYITYNGTNFIINPKEVGSGYLNVMGQILVDDKIMFTQTDGNEYIDSLADGYLDIGATTAIRMKADTTLDADKSLSLSGSGYVDSPSYKAGGTAPVADATWPVHNDGVTSGQVTSITTKGGLITAIAVIP